MTKPARKKPKPAAAARDVRLNLGTDISITLPSGINYAAIAATWRKNLASRQYWANRSDAREKKIAAAAATLKDGLGLDAAQMMAIARCEHLEVSFPAEAISGSWPSLDVPWEYLLHAGTASLRKSGGRILVTRHLSGTTPASLAIPDQLLFIENSPRKLEGVYNFDSERKAIAYGLGISDDTRIERSENDTPDVLARKLAAGFPVIHFTGFDARQAYNTLEKKDRPKVRPPDGIALRSASRPMDVLTPPDLVKAFTGKGAQPPTTLFTGFNCHNSGYEIAASAVAIGSRSALGFADTIADETAEFFFDALYAGWRAENWLIHRAFRRALDSLRQRNFRLHGSGIVLWTSESIRENPQPPVVDQAKIEADNLRPLWEQIHVDVKARPEINYSLLHNQQPLFERFRIIRRCGNARLPIVAHVELCTGSDTYPVRKSDPLFDQPLAYHDAIRLPLTSAFSRSARDRIRSTLYVRVSSGETVIHESSEPVTILPVDEWTDGVNANGLDSSGVWLPSFVLPRDAAVIDVIAAAQKFLVALSDTPQQGFDGYQGVEDDEKKGGRAATVDAQVKSIWYALSSSFSIDYINPPPTFTKKSQRVRTPSDVIKGGRGTCIDLMLLFAACLEYVEIYPALMIMKGHAFPAYWSSEEAHLRFKDAIQSRGAGASAGAKSWVIGPEQLSDIVALVEAGDIVAFDSVHLTRRLSLREACEEGLAWLGDGEDGKEFGQVFEYMLDIILARQNDPPVTPLPIL